MQSFEPTAGNENLSYGIIWHSILEDVLNAYKENNNKLSAKDFYEVVQKTLHKSIDQEGQFYTKAEQKVKSELSMRIMCSLEGWRLNWEKNITPNYDVVGVELTVSRPCYVGELGVQFCLPVIKCKDENGVYLRPVFMGEVKEFENRGGEVLECNPFNVQQAKVGDVLEAEVPYTKVGKIDCVLRGKGTNNLYILDHKTTSRPALYERNLKFDYQMQTYAALLQWEINEGLRPELEGCEVIGGMWDLCHSRIPLTVETIRNGTKLSTAKSKSIPSYVFRNAIAQNGFDEKDYSDHLKYIEQTVDQKYFVLCETYYTQKDFDRCYSEDWAKAHELGNLRLSLSCISDDDEDYLNFAAIAPRNNTICTQWGNCTYSQNCVANAPLALYNNTKRTKIKWYVQ